jgi:hypothetical protein
MRRTRSGWGEDDLSRLYRSFGFREITRPVHLIVFMSTLITLTYEPRSPERSHSPKACDYMLCGSLISSWPARKEEHRDEGRRVL